MFQINYSEKGSNNRALQKIPFLDGSGFYSILKVK